MAEKRKRTRRKKKRKNRKLLASTAAFITAAVVVVFSCYYIYYKSPYFDLVGIYVDGNLTYSDEYILDKSAIKMGDKIFSVDRQEVKENLQDQVYVESARVVYNLPNKIILYIVERVDKYQVLYNDEYIIIDKNAIVLRTNNINELDLITIESRSNLVYNVGDTIQIAGIENIQKVFDAIEYLHSEYGDELVINFKIDIDNSFLFETRYGTSVKIDLGEDVNYQIVFAMKIISERLNSNLTVSSGLIDFTKGDSPVYTEDFNMEEY